MFASPPSMLHRCGKKVQTLVAEERRELFDRITGTQNREIMLIGLKGGGLIAVVIQSLRPDSFMARMHRTFSKSALRQLSGTRSGLFFAGLSGLQGHQLLSVSGQDNDPNSPPTALALEASRLLGSLSRNHLVGIAFIAESALSPVTDGVVEAGGTAYHFQNKESRFWHQNLAGLFSPRN